MPDSPTTRATQGRQRRDGVDSDRRREILKVAASLFAEKGFHGTSMDDIAHNMGMLKGSLYYWIKSKDELLKAILSESMVDTLADAAAIEQSDRTPPEKLRALIDAHIESWIRNPDNFNVFLYEYRFLSRDDIRDLRKDSISLEQTYRNVLRDGIESGDFALDQKDVSLTVNSIFGLMNWFPRWFHPDGWADSNYISRVMADLVLAGLVARRP